MYRFDEFIIDAEAGELRRGDKRVELRAKCFDLLLFLASHPGKLLTKDELLRHVWPDTIVADATLSRTIADVREALSDDAASPKYIETVARRGYRFVAPVETRVHGSPIAFLLTHEGRELPLANGEHVIGRSADVSIPIYSRSISRRHARIIIDGSSASIEDLGSKNGTLVNGRAVQGRVPLSPGDKISVGDETLTLWSIKDVTTEKRPVER
jgi:DNA-binding winged helix-turn-helix (wHTH) protein